MSSGSRRAVHPSALWLMGLAAALVSRPALAGQAEAALAKEILAAAGVRGGLVVHLGCGDGRLTAALAASESYLVHGLNVAKARAHVRERGLSGAVAIERLAGGTLPHADGLVNLVVAERLGGVAMDEVMRVLAPRGVAYVKRNGNWARTVKP